MNVCKYSLISSLLLLIFVLTPAGYCHDYSAPYFYLSGVYTDQVSREYPQVTDEEMTWLLRQAQDDDRNIRAIAIGALGQTRDKRAVDPLLKALRDKSSFVRMNAAMAFVHIQDPCAINPLISALSNMEEYGDSYVFLAAIYSLAAQGEAGIDALFNTDSDLLADDKVVEITRAIWILKGKGYIDWSLESLNSSNRNVRAVACASLLEYIEQEESRLADIKKQFTDSNREKLILEDALDDSYKDNLYAIDAILLFGSGQDIQKLKDAVIDKSRENKQTLETEIERYSASAGGTTASKPLKDTDISKLVKTVKQAKYNKEDEGDVSEKSDAYIAANRLASSSNKKAINALIQLLKSDNELVQMTVFHVLDDADNPLVSDSLLAIAQGKKSPLKDEATGLLFERRDKRMISFYISLLSKKSEIIVPRAIDVLSYIGDPKSAPALIKLLNGDYAHYCIDAFRQIKNPIAIEPLISLLKREYQNESLHMALKAQGEAAIDPLITHIKDKDSNIRCGVAYTLAQFDNAKVTTALISLAGDKSPSVRNAAVQALSSRSSPNARSAVVKALKDNNISVRRTAACACAKSVPSDETDMLAQLLEDKDKSIRLYAGVALAQLGDRRGLQAVKQVLVPKIEMDGGEEFEEWTSFGDLIIPAIKGAGVLKEKQLATPIMCLLGEDISMSVFDGASEEQLASSREAKLDALRSITGKDFGRAYYRWMSYWISQENTVNLFTDGSEKWDEEEPVQ